MLSADEQEIFDQYYRAILNGLYAGIGVGLRTKIMNKINAYALEATRDALARRREVLKESDFHVNPND